MFRARMSAHEVCSPVAVDDGLGFVYEDYSEPWEAFVYVVATSQSTLSQNEFYVKRFDFVGFTYDKVEEGSKISDGARNWKVDSVDVLRNGQRVLGLVSYG